MERVTLQTLSVCLLLCLFVTVFGHVKNKKALDDLEGEIENLKSEAQEKLLMIDLLEEGLQGKIDNITMGESTDDVEVTTSSSVEPEATEPEADQSDRMSKIIALFERVETKMKLIKQFVAEEASVDQFLASLDGKLKNDFVVVKETVDGRTSFMREEVVSRIEDVKSTLGTVDTYARSRNKDIAGALYHGGIGSTCPTGSTDCRLLNSSCFSGVCQCDPGFSYDALLQQCVEECRFYGETFQMIPNYIIRGFNTLVLNETTIEECKATCLEATDFECRSVDYFPRWNACYLSDVINSNETEVAWEYNNAGNHYHRDCAYY